MGTPRLVSAGEGLRLLLLEGASPLAFWPAGRFHSRLPVRSLCMMAAPDAGDASSLVDWATKRKEDAGMPSYFSLPHGRGGGSRSADAGGGSGAGQQRGRGSGGPRHGSIPPLVDIPHEIVSAVLHGGLSPQGGRGHGWTLGWGLGASKPCGVQPENGSACSTSPYPGASLPPCRALLQRQRSNMIGRGEEEGSKDRAQPCNTPCFWPPHAPQPHTSHLICQALRPGMPVMGFGE